MSSTSNRTKNNNKRKRRRKSTTTSQQQHQIMELRSSSKSCFREVPIASKATSLTDGIKLANSNVIMPWVGFGTYRMKDDAQAAVLQALQHGYRSIDTAFIYSSEKTETKVGNAIQTAIKTGVIQNRKDVFITTKQWRKYHGYEPTLQCLQLSLKRLQLDYVDLYLMHWPGPAWSTMTRIKTNVENNPWHYATTNPTDMAKLRGETWRAMEDACRQGKCRAIGVSNCSIQHLESLKKTATIWPPAINQIEFHPLYPQTELLEYCKNEGIVVQAYASLGGQDTGKSAWSKLLGDHNNNSKKNNENATDGRSNGNKTTKGKKKKKNEEKHDLLHCEPVSKLAADVSSTEGRIVTPAQVLLRWALEQNVAIIPKTTSITRMKENANIFDFHISKSRVDKLTQQLLTTVQQNNPTHEGNLNEITRLCWRSDPLRQLDFE